MPITICRLDHEMYTVTKYQWIKVGTLVSSLIDSHRGPRKDINAQGLGIQLGSELSASDLSSAAKENNAEY